MCSADCGLCENSMASALKDSIINGIQHFEIPLTTNINIFKFSNLQINLFGNHRSFQICGNRKMITSTCWIKDGIGIRNLESIYFKSKS